MWYNHPEMPKYKISKKEQKIGKARDILDAMGQDSEKKAKKWVIYFNRLAEKEELEENQLKEEKLKKNRRKKSDYFRILSEMLKNLAVSVERPIPGLVVDAGFDSVGVWVELKTYWGKTYKRAIKPTGIPKYDLPAIMTMVGSLEDTMWKFADEKTTPKGVFLPS